MLFYLNLFRQLEKLSGEGSQKQKQEILKTNLDEKLSYLLDVCFNPFVTTKLHKINFLPEVTGSHEDLWGDFVSLVEELKKSPAANDQLRSRAEILVSHKLSDDQHLSISI
jgi:hypothetical protein